MKKAGEINLTEHVLGRDRFMKENYTYCSLQRVAKPKFRIIHSLYNREVNLVRLFVNYVHKLL